MHLSKILPGVLANATATAESKTSCDFPVFEPELDAYNPSLCDVKATLSRFVADMGSRVVEPYWITLSGVPGCGKTMLARQVFAASKVRNPGNCPIWPPDWATATGRKTSDDYPRRPYCIWLDSSKFAARLRGGEYDLPENLGDDFFVAFDDLGSSRDKTDFISDALYQLANRRARKWMLWTTNLTMEEISTRMDDRIASRLVRENNKFFTIDAGDYALRSL